MLSVMDRECRRCRVTPLTPLLLLFCSPTVAENSAEAYFHALANHLGKNASTTQSMPAVRGTRRGYCTESNLYNCLGNANCCDPAATCFAKDAKVAVCKTQCTPGVHSDDPPQYQTPWSCDVVGAEKNGVASQCAASYRGNCLGNPRCCDGSFTCFERDSIYGACLPSCRAGIHWEDPPQYRFPWSCRAIYPSYPSPPPPPPPPAPSPPQSCKASYSVNCKWSPVCCESGFQCYEKNSGYAACLPYCTPGIHYAEPEEYRAPWSCRLIQPGGSPSPPPTPPPPPPPPPPPAPTPPPPPPPASCTASWNRNCVSTPTCCEGGFTCYEKGSGYGLCLPSCVPGIHWEEPAQYQTPWSCRVIGGPSPPPPPPPPPPPTPAPTPPPSQCSASYGGNCLATPTCCDPAMTCFMKNSEYGQCMGQCSPGIHYNDPPQYQTPWACTPVGGPGPPPPPPPPPPTPTPPPSPPPSPSPGPSPSTTAAPGSGNNLEIPFASESLYKPSNADLLTYHMYRAQGHSSYPPLNVNAGNLAGIMWYIQNEVVSGAYGSGNKFGIERILRFKVHMKATQPLIDAGMNFGVRVAFDYGNCTGPSCVWDWQHYGYNIGCNNLGSFPFPKFETYYPGGVWYSLPGPCPQMPYYSQTDRCEQLQPGGKCGSPTGAGDCTWSYLEEGEQIWLGELYGASNMSMDQFWNNSENATFNRFKIKIARDMFEKKFGAELPNPPCDFNLDQFYDGRDPSSLP